MTAEEKSFLKSLEKLTEKGELRSLTLYHNKTELVIAGDSQILRFVTERTHDSITLKELKEKMEELLTSREEHKYKRLISFPRLPVKFRSKKWSWIIARRVLQQYLQVEGFGKGSKKCFGREEDRPEHWPETVSWATFKGYSSANIETCNDIIQSFLRSRHLDPWEYHDVIEPEVEKLGNDHENSVDEGETLEEDSWNIDSGDDDVHVQDPLSMDQDLSDPEDDDEDDDEDDTNPCYNDELPHHEQSLDEIDIQSKDTAPFLEPVLAACTAH